MNFEPPKSCDVVEFLRLDQKTFKDRMQVCMANLGGKLTAVDTHTYHFSPKTARVNLATFAAVVSKWGWPIPQQLQALEQHAPKFEAWPLNSEPQPAPATTDTNKTKRQDGLSTPDIAVLFDNAPYQSHQWGRRTSDRKWLESARLAMGAKGGAPALWCPLKLGRLVWEKYPDKVTVYTITGSNGEVYSRELCGGPHVAHTSDIQGVFEITKEESSSAALNISADDATEGAATAVQAFFAHALKNTKTNKEK
jgi:hypothetical protein